ncbi:hypothetical protein [Micrococcus luteus]|uniref:hypothetical protein n=1 Tax=Micrococcus luteus TaxID=1270 RepID=UPI0011C07AD5|nr:hypothetical protein [Micrococcus luteus]MCD0172814.1 hypothetical protein [Micrococcus luteus]MCD0184799.1 hypothetical protein [Micrococcus luteus]MCT1761470.1 hypothetical protein [Micrococcus luteus]
MDDVDEVVRLPILMLGRMQVVAHPQSVRHPAGGEGLNELEETYATQSLGHFRGADARGRDPLTDGRGNIVEVRVDDRREQLNARHLPPRDLFSDADFVPHEQVTPAE